MGLLDMVEGMAGGGGNTNAQAAGGLMQALDQHPGGLAGVLQSFQQNGMGQHVQDMQSGQTTQLTPEQVQQGTQGTGLIESVAEKAGISPEMAKIGMAVALPMIISHFSQSGGQMPQQGQFGGLASSILGKFL